MRIRPAKQSDIPAIENLLKQILLVHHDVRPDIFQADGSKFTGQELSEMLADNQKPIFVYVDENDDVKGHLFTAFKNSECPKVPRKTLFIEDLCVDEEMRGQKIGEQLLQFAIDYAKENGCYNVTLNVWNANQGALRFYENQGLKPQETCMEKIL